MKMRRIFNLLEGGCLGMLLGYFGAFLLSCSVWLEMRFNVGLLIPVGMLLGALYFQIKKPNFSYAWHLALQGGLLFFFLLLHPFTGGALLVVPACLFREGCYLSGLSIDRSNMILGIMLLLGNLTAILKADRQRKKPFHGPE